MSNRRALRSRPVCAAFLSLTLTAAATTQLQLTTGSGGGERQPVVNEAGTVVAYGALVGSVRELFTVPVDGGGPVRRTTGGNVIFDFGTFGNWPSLSISAGGTRITYWNSQGVHVVDTAANTDLVVAGSSTNPYPRIDPTGANVVYQTVVGSSFEVFVVPATGGMPLQLTTGSGGGSRHPDINGSRVVFQDVVGGNQELFALTLPSLARTQITSGSGGGNRYAHLSSDGSLVVYEAVVNNLEVFTVDPVAGIPSQKQVSFTNSGGARIAVPGRDRLITFQSVAGGALQVFLMDSDGSALTQMTYVTDGANKRPSLDGHGHVLVYQVSVGASIEVFRIRRCPEAGVSSFGVHGTPSVGSLASFDRWFRCDLTLGLATALPPNTPALMLLGIAGINPGLPIGGAPGNFVYVQPILVLPAPLDPLMNAQLTFPVGLELVGATVFSQFALFDPRANAAGIVTSEGRKVGF